jgi:hypothetical protein
MQRIPISVTTATDGTGTGYGSAVAGAGKVYAVQLVDGDFADGVDVTITFEEQNYSYPVLVKADFNSDQIVYPRVLEALNTDGTALATHCKPVAFGRPKVVIAQGGSVKSGSFVIYVEP